MSSLILLFNRQTAGRLQTSITSLKFQPIGSLSVDYLVVRPLPEVEMDFSVTYRWEETVLHCHGPFTNILKGITGRPAGVGLMWDTEALETPTLWLGINKIFKSLIYRVFCVHLKFTPMMKGFSLSL